jgi:hypothetical protein
MANSLAGEPASSSRDNTRAAQQQRALVERVSAVPQLKPPENMSTDKERCAEARKFRRIDGAFRAGDLEGLRAAEVRIDRRPLVNGLFYGVEGMRVGGTRRLEIAPHLGYGDRGVPGVIPPGAVLNAEITILAAA